MRNLCFIYMGDAYTHAFDKVFSGRSAFERVLEWGSRVQFSCTQIIACTEENANTVKEILMASEIKDAKVITRSAWTLLDLLNAMVDESHASEAENVVFAFADQPFLDSALTDRLIDAYKKYISEYTFQDGYPYGFAPEIIYIRTLEVLVRLAKTTQSDLGSASVTKDSIYNLIKTNVNAFEIESVIAPKDYRMLRLNFSCREKRNLIACKKLYDYAEENKLDFSAESLSDYAVQSGSIQKTLPAFYEVQIAQNISSYPIYDPYPDAFKSKYGFLPVENENKTPSNMKVGNFESLIKRISDFSGDAVVSLSAWGEPLLHNEFCSFVECILKEKQLRVLIETDGLLVTDKLASSVKELVEKYREPNPHGDVINWIVKIDAATEETYKKIVDKGDFSRALSAVDFLENYFPGCVYPQFTRMNENEDELEAFYRYWSNTGSPSNGRLIIQKYNDFCAALPPRKPADVAPVDRIPCWHLKRDMVILCDGDVPLCKNSLLTPVGNVFKEDLESIWEKRSKQLQDQINKIYDGLCRACDEYYTFNF